MTFLNDYIFAYKHVHITFALNKIKFTVSFLSFCLKYFERGINLNFLANAPLSNGQLERTRTGYDQFQDCCKNCSLNLGFVYMGAKRCYGSFTA